jgi:ATP-binding cassette subfamily B multidrug efflux pump
MVQIEHYEEEALGKVYDARLMKRLLSYVRPYKRWVVASVVLLLVGSAAELAGPYLVKIGIDSYISVGDKKGLALVSLGLLGINVAAFALYYWQIYLMNLMGQKVIYDLRTELFSHVQTQSVAFFDRNPVGRLMSRIMTDIQVLDELYTSGVVMTLGDLFTLLGIMGIMLAMNFKLALVTFVVLPLLFVTSMLFRSKVRDAYRQIRVRIAKINIFLQENISGIRTVQMFNREARNFAKFERLNHDHLDAFLRSITYYAIFFPVIEIIGAVALGLIIWYGGGEVLSGTLTLGTLVAFTQYTTRFFQPIRDLSEKYNIMQSAMASSERLFKLMDKQTTLPEPQKGRLPGDGGGALEFDDVSFAYDHELVLKNMTFRVEPGESVAFVGATGAGKTTIMNLLCRFYDPTGGSVKLDGVDLRDIDQEFLRRQMTIVLQDVYLFSGSIKDNIRLANTSIPDHKVLDAVRRARVSDLVEKLPMGLDQQVGERGIALSAGQRQLIAFARALAFDPRILILDEATSSVDAETEALIREALAEVMKGRTSIIIAHRLSTIKGADRIVVVHKGRIRETGTHQELLKQRGIYYRLYQIQYSDQEALERDARSL